MDPYLNVVKGRGGALLREKVSASSALPKLCAGGYAYMQTLRSSLVRQPHPRQTRVSAQMVEMASKKFVCIVDDTKLVEGLGGSGGDTVRSSKLLSFCPAVVGFSTHLWNLPLPGFVCKVLR